jgi:hypothetical protein
MSTAPISNEFRRAVAQHRNGLTTFERAAYCVAATAAASDVIKGGPAGFARERYGSEAIAQIVKAATSPASSTGWGKELSGDTIGDFIAALPGAASRLISAGVTTSLAGVNAILFPSRAVSLASTNSSWTAEGSPAAIQQISLSGDIKLGPTKKLTSVLVATRELFEHTDAENIFGVLLRENIAYGLDSKMFSSDEGTDSAPAGLLFGVAGLTPSADADSDAAMKSDLEQLAIAISGASVSPTYIMHPQQAISAALRLLPNRVQIWPSLAVPVGAVICLDPQNFVSALGPEIRIEGSREAAIHLEDTTPLDIGTAVEGEANVIAAPVLSAYQSDVVCTKATARVAYMMRVPNAVAWMADVVWGQALL